MSQPPSDPLYIVRDAMGATYGPADIATLSQWIAQGRITPQMQIAPHGSQAFLPAGQIPELQAAFASPGTIAQSPGPGLPAAYDPAAAGSYPQNYYTPANTRDSTLAIAALVCGCASFLCGLSAIAAIILGHMARGKIRREPERYDGAGMATAGMIIGYVYLAIAAVIVILYVLFFLLLIGTTAGSLR